LLTWQIPPSDSNFSWCAIASKPSSHLAPVYPKPQSQTPSGCFAVTPD
jgi:hypothetical protein